jgi:thiol-disulfide isomerase/thioredoxin
MKSGTICLSLLLLMLTFSPGCISGDDAEKLEPVPAFSVVADDNMTYSSDNLLGTPYILHFSASWCSQCRATMHAVDAQLSEHTYLIVSTDDSDSTKLSDWHLQVNESQADSTVAAPFSANAPTLILVGSDGSMIDRHFGPMTETSVIDEFWSQAV